MALVTITIARRPQGPRTARSRRARNTGIAAIGGAAVLVASVLISAPASATGVVPITPHTLLNNTFLGANKSVSPVVLGGAAGVPTDATRVRLSVTATGKSDGTLVVGPAGDSTTVASAVPFVANQQLGVGLTERVGLQNKVSFLNQSSNTLVLTVKITGYSTQVDDSDITGRGGTPGEVLTNTGLGASWQPDGHAYADEPGDSFALSLAIRTVASVTVPPGSYMATFTGFLLPTTSLASSVECLIGTQTPFSVESRFDGGASSGTQGGSVAGQALISTTTGNVIVECGLNGGAATMYDRHLIVTSVGSVSGAVLH